MRKFCSVPVLVLGSTAVFFTAAPMLAQVDRSAVTGTVTDPSGRLLGQAHVLAVELSTQLRREGFSDGVGRYELAELPVGKYTITVDHPGFEKLTFADVEQVVGRTRTLNAALKLSGGEEHVEVSAASEILDTDTAAVTGLIERKQADELPLNGRDWSQLTAYIPGAIDTGGSNQRSIRFAGRGLDDSNFTYDGVDATNVVNQTQRAWARLAIPLDAISEFRVDTLLATADEGASGGAQLAVVSPAGTNRFHGRLFEFLRNSAFDAPEPAWAGVAQQPLHLNQFGGSLGGPIVHDKTFFYLDSEAYRQVWGYPTTGVVPSAAFKASIPVSSPVYSIVNAYPGAGPKTTLTPYTPANDPNDPFYANYDLLTCSCTQVVNENSAMLRLDQHFTNATTGFMRFNYDRSVDTQPVSAAATDLAQRVTSPVNGVLELLHVFSPYLTNEVKFGFNRSSSNTYDLGANGTNYEIVISQPLGPGFVTQNYNYNTVYYGNSFSEIDDLTWLHGRHTVKAGVEIRQIQLNQNYGQHGVVTFATPETLATNTVRKATLTGALPVNDLRKTDSIGYLQDELKATPNLMLNFGVRYSVFDLFHEAHGKANPFDFATCGPQGFCGVGASFGIQNYGDFDPRVGVIYAVPGGGKPILRAGFGMYHEDGQMDDQNLPAKNEVPSYSVTGTAATPVTYPVNPFLVSANLSPNAEQRNRKDSYTEQWDLSLQRELPANFVGTITYLGSNGRHLLDLNEVNLVDPSTGKLQYPGFSPAIAWRGSIGASSYNGLTVSMRRPFTHGFLVAFNYAYTHELDNGSNGSGDGDELAPQNPTCLSCEWASGAWDARHVANGNFVYELPFGHGKRLLSHGFASTVLGNWQLTGTALARTGFPINVLLPSSYVSPYGNSGTLRPNRVAGVSLTPAGGRSVSHWINPSAFSVPANSGGTLLALGNAPRNLYPGPGTWQADTGIAKTFPIGEVARVEFRSEFYNVFNHPQLGPPNATFGAAGFGSITTAVNLNTAIVSPITPVGSGTPREMQFALRLEF